MNKILCNTKVGLYKNLWQTHYDKLIDDIYTTKNIIEIYNHTIKQNINK